MTIPKNILLILCMTGYSVTASSEAVTGKIIIDGREYSSSSSKMIQGSGHVITAKRELGLFNKLTINIPADIEYVASNNNQVVLSADDNIAPLISTTIRNNTLWIDSDRNFSTQSRTHLTISGSPSLRSLLVDSSANINLQGISSDIFEINLEGTGRITAQGKTRKLILKADGSGNIDTKALQADDVIINIDGSVDLTVRAHNNLDITIDGVSDVTYYGNPDTITKAIDGVGKISEGI